jgi:hypothetical protein
MRNLRIVIFISIPIVAVLIGMLVVLSITGTGDREDRDKRGIPVYATPTLLAKSSVP